MNTKTILKSLRMCKKVLNQFNKDLPDQDEYAMAYCIASDVIKEIDFALKDIRPALKEAREISKKKRKKNGNVSST